MLATWGNLGRYERVKGEETDCRGKTVSRDVGKANADVKSFSMCSLIVAFLLGALCTAAIAAIVLSSSSSVTYETGFHTDIASLRDIVDVVPTQFTGTLRYKNGEHLYIDLGPDGVQYFGGPSEDIDHAWDDLLTGLDEETFFEGETVGVDVLHSLHCLNEVRKVLNSRHYYNRTLESMNRGKRIHIDHCLNHIRQVLQCHMDLTPIKTEYFKDINVEVGSFDEIHMCRDFSKLRSWMKEKQNTRTVAAVEVQAEHNDDLVRHRLGYPDNEESELPWNATETEFD